MSATKRSDADGATSPGDGWVQIFKWARLWSSVPQEHRVTEELLRKEEIELLVSPECEIAIRWHADLWKPCNKKVFHGADRCPTHGGPLSGRLVRLNLKEENDRLRSRIAELESAQTTDVAS